jgi:hypothetical protein
MNVTIVRTRTVVAAVGLCLCIILTGCGPKNIKTHPDIAGKAQAIKTIALAEPEIKVYEISAGGVPELVSDWSALGRENVTKALQAAINRSSMRITSLKPDTATEEELVEVMALFEMVIYSIVNHTSTANGNPNLFPDKLQNFDYSVGSLETILKSSGGDALLLVQGMDQIATAGKKALNTLGTITGIAVGALTGVYSGPRMEGTRIRMALADRNGTILWYNISGGVYDLRDPESSSDIVRLTLEDFPGIGK